MPPLSRTSVSGKFLPGSRNSRTANRAFRRGHGAQAQASGLPKNRALRMAEVAKSNSKAPRPRRHRSDMVVSAAPAHAPTDAAE